MQLPKVAHLLPRIWLTPEEPSSCYSDKAISNHKFHKLTLREKNIWEFKHVGHCKILPHSFAIRIDTLLVVLGVIIYNPAVFQR